MIGAFRYGLLVNQLEHHYVCLISNCHLTLKEKKTSQEVETSVTTNTPSQDSFHQGKQIPLKYVTLELKPVVIFLVSIFHFTSKFSPEVKIIFNFAPCSMIIMQVIVYHTESLEYSCF